MGRQHLHNIVPMFMMNLFGLLAIHFHVSLRDMLSIQGVMYDQSVSGDIMAHRLCTHVYRASLLQAFLYLPSIMGNRLMTLLLRSVTHMTAQTQVAYCQCKVQHSSDHEAMFHPYVRVFDCLVRFDLIYFSTKHNQVRFCKAVFCLL